MAADLTQPAVELGSRARLTKLVYAALFLITTSGLFYFGMTDYDVHLVTTKQFALSRTVAGYLPPGQLLFFFVQLLVVLLFFRPVGLMFDLRAVRSPRRSVFRNICLGLLAGLTALLVTLPSFVGTYGPSGIVVFLADHLFTVSTLGLVLLLVFLLPFAEAIFFHGIVLRQLLESISAVSALVVSTLLFMFSWPTFNVIAGAALGLVAGIVFCRTKSVLACAVAHASFTVGAIMFQLWRLP